MKLPEEVREGFREYGRVGGRRRASRMSPAARTAVARRAATARWIGAPNFTSLGLPGGSLVDAGRADLAEGKTTPASLAVSLAAPRLQREGVPIRIFEPDPEKRLFAMLSETEGELAHARYGAYLRRIVSFADACRSSRIDGSDRAS